MLEENLDKKSILETPKSLEQLRQPLESEISKNIIIQPGNLPGKNLRSR